MSIYDMFADSPQYELPLLSMTIGIVTDIDDPDKMGKVKVKLINRSTSEFETDYIRTMTPMTGKESGFYFLPEVGDEVLVGFCDGDIHAPYVLGCLWNKEYKQPAAIQDKKNDIRMIKTKGGHTITFSDEKDKEGITIETTAGLNLTMQDKETIITLSNKDKTTKLVLDAKGKKIDLETDGELTLTAKGTSAKFDGQNIALDAKGKVSLAGQEIELNAKNGVKIAGVNVNIDAKSAVAIKANAKLDASASGPLSVKGAIVKIN